MRYYVYNEPIRRPPLRVPRLPTPSHPRIRAVRYRYVGDSQPEHEVVSRIRRQARSDQRAARTQGRGGAQESQQKRIVNAIAGRSIFEQARRQFSGFAAEPYILGPGLANHLTT